MPDYYSQYCVCGPEEINLGMRDLDGNETTSYPVDVYNVNEELIGIAANKAEYITVWNNDPANQAVGTLGNGLGPFGFKIVLNDGQEAPDWVIGVSQVATRPVGIYESQYEDQYE